MRQILRRCRTILGDVSGNILPIAAMGMLVAAIVVGSAIDLSRNYKAGNQLQAACDAAVLAARRSVTTKGFDQNAKDVAKNYFATNFEEGSADASLTSFLAKSEDDGQTVTGSASTTVKTLVMQLFGFNSFPVSVTCTSSMGVGNADVMMVLDTTGSMGDALGSSTRIAALRLAMKNFYNTLAAANKQSNARLRYGFVPYSSSVNVGKLLVDLDPSYVADSWDYQSRQPIFINAAAGKNTSSKNEYKNETSGSVKGSTSYSSNKCGNAVPASDADYSNNGTATKSTSTSGTSPNITVTVVTTQPQRKIEYACKQSGSKYYIYTITSTRDKATTDGYSDATVNVPTPGYTFDHFEYAKITRATNVFKTFASTTVYNGTKGAATNYTWGGCIEERYTPQSAATFSYSSLTGMSPSDALDVDIDTAPGSATSTKWGPLWPQIGYRRAGSSSETWTLDPGTTGAAAGTYCPVKAQLLKEMDKDSFNTYADSLTAVGGTYLDIGMIWGGRMLSPDGIFNKVVNEEPSNGGEVSRHIIFMTDGQMDTSNYIPSAWGMDWWDRRVTADGSETTANARHTSRFLAVCEAIKAKGIRVWVIAFTSGLSTDLKACASDDSSYIANDSAQLDSAFQEIAKQVGELRITQ